MMPEKVYCMRTLHVYVYYYSVWSWVWQAKRLSRLHLKKRGWYSCLAIRDRVAATPREISSKARRRYSLPCWAVYYEHTRETEIAAIH